MTVQKKIRPRPPGRRRRAPTWAPRVLVLEVEPGDVSRCVELAGGVAHVANPRDARAVDAALRRDPDALVLCGGGDVDPARYGARRLHPRVYGVHETRDATELEALDAAGDLGIPVLGICRGMQLMNVYTGGTLYQDLAVRSAGTSPRHRRGRLPVTTLPGTEVRRALGAASTHVMHLHHQAVRALGAGLRVAARHADGTVEALESTLPGAWWVGVQFHPEYALEGEPDFGLFTRLVREATARRARQHDRPAGVTPSVTLAEALATAKDLRRWGCTTST